MNIHPDLSHFVRDALNKGLEPDCIRQNLQSADWTDSEIDVALAGWSHQDCAGAIPRPIRSTAARDAFFYTLLFVVFGMVFGSTLNLLLGLVNIWFPEPSESLAYGRLSGLRWSMAALIIFVPVFWALDRIDRREASANPALKHVMVRRWLSALAMFVATITVLGDGLYLIYSWLDGQITFRFLTKSAMVALISAVAFAYFGETRKILKISTRIPACWILIGLAILSLVMSFWQVGGPVQGQMEQRDRWRISDLRTLANDVAQCSEIDAAALPGTFDPMTCARNPARLTGYGSEITYKRTTVTAFSLCIEVEYPAAVDGYDVRLDGNTACIDRKSD